MDDLEAARARRWWRTGRRVGSLTRAAAFVDWAAFPPDTRIFGRS